MNGTFLGYTRRKFARVLGLGLLIGGCGGVTPSTQTGGESHFLRVCSDSCGGGLDCISGVCTRGCLIGEAACTDLSTKAACTDESVEPGEVAVCDVGCERDADCAPLGSTHRCTAGFCRGGAPSDDKPDTVPRDKGCEVLHQTYASGESTPNPGGCGACSCQDGELSCDPLECEIGPLVFACPEDVVSDPVEVVSSGILGDELFLEVAFGGGCETHDFGVCYEPGFLESYPVQTSLHLIHDAQGDGCEAGMIESLRFDLRPLTVAYEESYQSASGLISTNYGLYAFGTLSCEERDRAVQEQTNWLVEQLQGTSCSVPEDCEWASTDTTCSARCGAEIPKSEAASLAEGLNAIGASVCRDYEADGCGPVIVPPCIPPGELDCIEGRCTSR